MKKSFRIAIENLAVAALNDLKIRATNDSVTAHKDASCTVMGVSAKAQARIANIPGIEVISTSDVSMKFRLLEAVAYAEKNPPYFTQAEKDAMEAAKAERAANKRTSNVPMLDMDEDEDDQE